MICEGSAAVPSVFSMVRCIGRGSLSSRSSVDRNAPSRSSCYRPETLCRDEVKAIGSILTPVSLFDDGKGLTLRGPDEALCCQGGDRETFGPHRRCLTFWSAHREMSRLDERR